MAYTPTEWASGDIVTSAKLNKLEQGVADAGSSFAPDITSPQDGDTLVYNATQQKWVNGAGAGGGVMILHEDENGVLDKTWAEIKTALSTMLVSVYSEYEDDGAFYTQTDIVNNVNYMQMTESDVYQVVCSINSYLTSSEGGYPAKN